MGQLCANSQKMVWNCTTFRCTLSLHSQLFADHRVPSSSMPCKIDLFVFSMCVVWEEVIQICQHLPKARGWLMTSSVLPQRVDFWNHQLLLTFYLRAHPTTHRTDLCIVLEYKSHLWKINNSSIMSVMITVIAATPLTFKLMRRGRNGQIEDLDLWHSSRDCL